MGRAWLVFALLALMGCSPGEELPHQPKEAKADTPKASRCRVSLSMTLGDAEDIELIAGGDKSLKFSVPMHDGEWACMMTQQISDRRLLSCRYGEISVDSWVWMGRSDNLVRITKSGDGSVFPMSTDIDVDCTLH